MIYGEMRKPQDFDFIFKINEKLIILRNISLQMA